MDVLKKLELAERRLRIQSRKTSSTRSTLSPGPTRSSTTTKATRTSKPKVYGPKQPKAGRPRGLTMRQEALISEAVAAGRTMRDIAAQYNVDPKTVSNVAKRNGVTPVRLRTAPR